MFTSRDMDAGSHTIQASYMLSREQFMGMFKEGNDITMMKFAS